MKLWLLVVGDIRPSELRFTIVTSFREVTKAVAVAVTRVNEAKTTTYHQVSPLPPTQHQRMMAAKEIKAALALRQGQTNKPPGIKPRSKAKEQDPGVPLLPGNV